MEIHRSFQWVLNVNLVLDILRRSNKVALTDNLDGWQRFDWIFHYFNYWREWVRMECGMSSCWEQSCDTDNDRSSYHCSKNWTVWELDPDSEKWENWYRKSMELSSCSSDHIPDCTVRLSWRLNLRRQVWLPYWITWQWTMELCSRLNTHVYTWFWTCEPVCHYGYSRWYRYPWSHPRNMVVTKSWRLRTSNSWIQLRRVRILLSAKVAWSVRFLQMMTGYRGFLPVILSPYTT